MSALWPHLLRPWSLLLLPLLGWLLWKLWHRQRRAGRWQLLLPAAFHPWMLSGGHGRHERRPWIFLGLAWLLAVLALLGPSWQYLEQPAMERSDPLVVVLELTPEMLATDLPPSRLEQARRKVLDLLRARSDAQTAIVVYAGSAHTLVPLSNDLGTARNLLDALKPSIMPAPGRRADLAIEQARQLLHHGAEGKGHILLITSALDAQERQGIRKALKGKGKDLLLLAIGTAGGAPIAQEDGTFLKDEQGNILVPRLDENALRQFASDLDGRFQRLRPGNADLRALGLLNNSQGLQVSEEDALLRLQRWADQGYWLLLPLLLLAACAGRRGWLFSLPLLLPLLWSPPQNANAFELADLWLTPDQQGQRLLDAQKPADAAEHFEDFRWRGLALYEAGDYADAAQAFALGDSAADHYNRGNALARQNELEAAIDAYDQALERAPDLLAAQRNKALLEDLLRQRQKASGEEESQSSQQQNPTQGESSEPQPVQPKDSKPKEEQSEEQDSQPTPSAQTPEQRDADKPADSQSNTPQATHGEDGETNLAITGPLTDERRQALEQWLRQIPDDPSELLRRKFWYQQQQQRQEPTQ
ncbi:VWA domain-containing protein [Pseudomonas sp. PSE14]|uniref:VWA domain-containing protein n=1 Tax=Pseudomonas sp. PSE14 TaxID=3016341 RepID=UPI0023D7EDA5|nr:VWA domain-containing protein [Pseudomonas sp. PSE14]WEJ73919.1 VWA domain-containing protein [Pseudomonas sp. PSE14]